MSEKTKISLCQMRATKFVMQDTFSLDAIALHSSLDHTCSNFLHTYTIPTEIFTLISIYKLKGELSSNGYGGCFSRHLRKHTYWMLYSNSKSFTGGEELDHPVMVH